MNLLDAVVTEVLGEPYEKYNKWWVSIKYNCYGVISEQQLMFDRFEHAKKVKVGYKFLT